MQQLAYLVGLLLSLAGTGLVDYRYRLALWHNARAAATVLAAGMLFFIAWDIAGIELQIFHSGHSQYMLGWYLLPDFPVEELFFLLLLLYTPLVLSSWLERRRV